MANTVLDDEQQFYVETIKTFGKVLLLVIKDILDYSKIEAGKIGLHPEPFDLENLIQQIFNINMRTKAF